MIELPRVAERPSPDAASWLMLAERTTAAARKRFSALKVYSEGRAAAQLFWAHILKGCLSATLSSVC